MPKTNGLRKMPKLETEDQERDFWSKHDSTDYIDWSRAERVKLPKLRPTTRTISIFGRGLARR